MNVERAAAGCEALTVDADLTEAAQDYTDDMAATGNFSHTGTDGPQPQDRIEAAGYVWSRSGETIAEGQADAAAVMDAWITVPATGPTSSTAASPRSASASAPTEAPGGSRTPALPLEPS
ncbi:CAP domain-containing protein [Streptomyces sp. NPDC013489]|uniref:CAP domain-containing protein n=1 Tax=Streptomyces sp. NPDC013489 TaxID=3155606 RepID=UPI003406ECC0